MLNKDVSPLGMLTDEITAEEDQSDLASIGIYQEDMVQFYDHLSDRLSKYTISYYLDAIKNTDMSYWGSVFTALIHIYRLDSLKLYIDDVFVDPDKVIEAKKLLHYIKVDLIDFILNGKLDKDITRDDLETFLMNDKNTPEYMITAIKYIDRECYREFISAIMHESTLDYEEI